MPDPRLEQYLREHAARYPLDVLKQTLIGSGVPAADVEEAVRAFLTPRAQDPAPAAAPASGSQAAVPAVAPGGEPVELTLMELPRNSVLLARAPAELFARLAEGGLMQGAVYTFCWMLLGFLLFNAAQLLRGMALGGTWQRLIVTGLVSVFIGGSVAAFAATVQFAVAGLYHGLLAGLGGRSSYTGAFRVLSAVGPLNSLWILFSNGWIILAMGLCQAGLLALAAKSRFQLSAARAGILFAVWGGLAVVGFGGVFHTIAGLSHSVQDDVVEKVVRKPESLGDFTPRSKRDDPGYAAYSAGDFAAARDVWLKSARVMDADSFYSLGTLYWTGRGVAVDAPEAYKWYVLAAFMGDPGAGQTALKVRGQLPPEVVSDGLRRAEEWLGARFSAEFARRYGLAPAASAPAGVGR